MEDKRRHKRFNVSTDRICTLRNLDSPSIVGNIEDVSRSGVRITSQKPLREDDIQDFLIRASWIDRDILVKLKMEWKDSFPGRCIYGARFISINTEDIFELQDAPYSDWLNSVLTKK